MAQTLTQSVRMPGPSWDEEVVPALRKRLESESRTLARRLSYIDDPDSSQRSDSSHHHQADYYPKKNGSSSRTRPSPQSRNSDQSERVNGRARTYSQPFSSMANGDANGRPISSSKPPTRIPKAARSRTGSSVSPNLTITTTTPPLNGHSPSSELGPPTFTHSNTSHSTISVHTPPQSSGLLNEPPPFAGPDSTYSSQPSSNDDLYNPPPRPSQDSVEQPFEHWYRGEVSRNGGVGELRVGTRKEMLDIANYGHPIKVDQNQSRNAITEAIERHRGRRKRADSIGGLGAKDRESFYMDEDRANHLARVLDEAPLTDVDGDLSGGSDYYDEYSHAMHVDHRAASAAGLPRNRSTTPTGLPRPSSRQRTTTPTSRSVSENVPSSSTSTPIRKPQQRSASGSSTTTATPSSQQKRGVSPGTPSSAAKKTRTAASKATRAKLEAARREEDINNRRSVAHYPTPDENMENAIPQWTEPRPLDGNWDNVVLPVVARKQGLNNAYDTADGTPRPKGQQPVEPAPGTFGFDHSKYRPPRDDHFAPVQIDEFGQPTRIVEGPDSDQPYRPPILTPHDEVRVGQQQRPPSPVPFSHYTTGPQAGGGKGGKLQPISKKATKLEVADAKEQEAEDSAGCCKCVVM